MNTTTDTITDNTAAVDPSSVTPEKASAADRKAAAESVWFEAVTDIVTNDADIDAATIAASMSDAPSPAKVVDLCMAKSVGDLLESAQPGDIGAMTLAQKVSVFASAVKAALPTKSAAKTVIDPREELANQVAFLNLIADHAQGIADKLASDAETLLRDAKDNGMDMNTLVIPTLDDSSLTASLTKAIEKLSDPTPAKRGSSGDRAAVKTNFDNIGASSWEYAGVKLEISGDTMVEIGTGRLARFTDATIDGIPTSEKSASGAAKVANGGTEVNGREAWTQI